MGITIAENKKKLAGKKCCCRKHGGAERNYSAGDAKIKVTQLTFVLTPGESRHKNIDQHVHQHGEDHGEASECSYFRNRGRTTREKTNEKHGDLPLKTIKERVRGEIFDQAN